MASHPAPTTTGIVGCLDPVGSLSEKLACWADTRSARPWCNDGPFCLWGPEVGLPRAHQITAPGLCGLLIGDLYEPSLTTAAESVNAAPAERLVQIYRERGADGVFALNGQISLFLWDRGREELILFRDESGSRSLYFAELADGGLAFADNLDLLVASPLVEKRLARRSIHEYLRFLDVSPPNSIYEGVTASEPGILYRMDKNLAVTRPPQTPTVPNPPRTLSEASDELEDLLAQAVSARLSPNEITVAFLSGGVDSSLICLKAAARGGRVEAITVGFDESDFDESRVARRVANHLQVPHRVLTFPMSAYRDAFDALTAGIQYPSADPAGIPTLLAFQAARDIGPIALDGTGADTLFGVMPARHQRLAVQYGALLPLPARRLATWSLQVMPWLRHYAPLVDFDDPEEILIRWRGWSRGELEQLCGEPVSLEHTRFYRIFRQFPRGMHLERYSALLGNLPDDRIHQAAALTGLDVRFPYFDQRVAAWVENLDLGLRYDPTDPKPVLKTALARHIPRELWDQPKHGFDFPFLHLMTFDDCALVRRYLDPEVTERWDLFDPELIRATKDAFIRGDWRSAFAAQSPAFRTWALVLLFAWLENHFRHL